MRHKVVMAHDVIDALQHSGVMDLPSVDYLTRVVIDLQVGELPMLYTQQIADERLVGALLNAGMAPLPRTLPVEAWQPPSAS